MQFRTQSVLFGLCGETVTDSYFKGARRKDLGSQKLGQNAKGPKSMATNRKAPCSMVPPYRTKFLFLCIANPCGAGVYFLASSWV